MEGVVAGTPDERTIVARELTIRAAAVKCHPAYAACFILGVPCPRSHPMPLKNLDLHLGTGRRGEGWAVGAVNKGRARR
jgi:hypothetical protein